MCSASSGAAEENIANSLHGELTEDNNLLSLVLNDLLPGGFSTKVLSIQKCGDGFKAEIRANISSKCDAIRWLKEFENTSCTNFRSLKTYPGNKKSYIFKEVFRCHHNTLASQPSSKTKKPHVKHVNCPAKITVTVKNSNMKWSSDLYLLSYPTVIALYHTHNHPLRTADALRYRKPEDRVKNAFIEMFRKGHSPSSALESFKFHLQDNNPDTYYEIVEDGAKCPSLKWCYHVYSMVFKGQNEDHNGEGMIESLKRNIDDYNKSCGSVCANCSVVDNDITVAICSPLMKRVHEHLQASGEIVFVDSGGCLNRRKSRAFLLLTPSVAGGLPVGAIITSSVSEFVLTSAFDLWRSILPENAFFGRGADRGSKVFMTEDSTSEKNAIKSCFSDTIPLLCKFHFLFAFWRYLHNGKCHVEKQDHLELYNLVKNLIDCKTIDLFNAFFADVMNHRLVKKYPVIHNHLRKLKKRDSEWAMCLREYTDNFSETAQRIEDKVLHRIKSFSVIQIFDFLTVHLEGYYVRRIQCVLNNTTINYSASHFFKTEELTPLSCERQSEDTFIVKNSASGEEYVVLTSIGTCSCSVGCSGAACKHQFAVFQQFKLSSSQSLTAGDVDSRTVLQSIMSGTNKIPDEWHNSLSIEPSVTVDTAKEVAVVAQEHDASEELRAGDSTSLKHNMQNEISDDGSDISDISSDVTDISEDDISPDSDTSVHIQMYEQLQSKILEDMNTRFRRQPVIYLKPDGKCVQRINSECKTDNENFSAFHALSSNNCAKSLQSTQTVSSNASAVVQRYVSSGWNTTGGTSNIANVYTQKRSAGKTQGTPPIKKSVLPYCVNQVE